MKNAAKELRGNAGRISIILSVFIIFTYIVTLQFLSSIFDNRDLDLFPEHIDYFRIDNPSAQKIAYFVSASFALGLCLSFATNVWDYKLFRKSITFAEFQWIRNIENNATRIAIEKICSEKKINPILVYTIFGATCILGFLLSKYAFFGSLVAADPHIFYVGAELAEAISHNKSIDPQLMTAYGIGPSLIYRFSGLFFEGNSYHKFVIISKIFNVTFASLFLLLCYKITLTKTGNYFSIILICLAFVFSLSLIGIINNGYVFATNSSAIRYTPFMFMLFVFLFFEEKKKQLWNVSAIIIASCLVVLFPDTGSISIIALLCFIITVRKIDFYSVVYLLSYLFIIIISYAIFNYIIYIATGINPSVIFVEMAKRFGENYGGILLKYNYKMFSMTLIVLICFFYFGYQSFRRQLNPAERIGMALAGSFIMLLMYYVNRPTSSYWIFGILVLIPAHLLLNEVFKLAEFRSTQLVFFLIYGSLLYATTTPYKYAIAVPLKNTPFFNTSEVLGMRTDDVRAKDFNARLTQLSKISKSRKDSIVFSTTPVAATSIGSLEQLPKELVFKNNNQRALTQTIKSIHEISPQFLVFENSWDNGYAFKVAEKVTHRIVTQLESEYSKICDFTYWMVYEKTTSHSVQNQECH